MKWRLFFVGVHLYKSTAGCCRAVLFSFPLSILTVEKPPQGPRCLRLLRCRVPLIRLERLNSNAVHKSVCFLTVHSLFGCQNVFSLNVQCVKFRHPVVGFFRWQRSFAHPPCPDLASDLRRTGYLKFFGGLFVYLPVGKPSYFNCIVSTYFY